MVTSAWLPALLAFVAVALVTVSGAVLLEWLGERRRNRQVTEQLRRVTLNDAAGPDGARESKLFRAVAASDSAWVDRIATRVPRVRDLQQVMEQAALDWPVRSFALLSVGLGLASYLSIIIFSGSALIAAGAASVGGLTPYFYIRRRRANRLFAFEAALPEAIDLLGRAIRAGHPLSAGLKMVADETAEPISGEFSRVFEELRFGLPFDDAITALGDRVPTTDVRIFITAVLIQREVGGNLAEVLDNLSSIIRQRFTLKRQVRVLTAEGRLSMYVLTLLPIGVGLWVGYTNPEYISLLFTHPLGKAMLGSALVAQAIGFVWMRSITNIEF